VAHWLLKTEPDQYSYQDLARDDPPLPPRSLTPLFKGGTAQFGGNRAIRGETEE
jgi:hypothetical protein